MTTPAGGRFDFDDWSRLARRDPAAFEARRQALIESLIQTAPAARRRRLRGLQWRIDRERERCGNPLSACIRLSDMMWHSFAGPGGLRQTLRRWRDDRPWAARTRCRVLEFPRGRPQPDEKAD